MYIILSIVFRKNFFRGHEKVLRKAFAELFSCRKSPERDNLKVFPQKNGFFTRIMLTNGDKCAIIKT